MPIAGYFRLSTSSTVIGALASHPEKRSLCFVRWTRATHQRASHQRGEPSNTLDLAASPNRSKRLAPR